MCRNPVSPPLSSAPPRPAQSSKKLAGVLSCVARLPLRCSRIGMYTCRAAPPSQRCSTRDPETPRLAPPKSSELCTHAYVSHLKCINVSLGLLEPVSTRQLTPPPRLGETTAHASAFQLPPLGSTKASRPGAILTVSLRMMGFGGGAGRARWRRPWKWWCVQTPRHRYGAAWCGSFIRAPTCSPIEAAKRGREAWRYSMASTCWRHSRARTTSALGSCSARCGASASAEQPRVLRRAKIRVPAILGWCVIRKYSEAEGFSPQGLGAKGPGRFLRACSDEDLWLLHTCSVRGAKGRRREMGSVRSHAFVWHGRPEILRSHGKR